MVRSCPRFPAPRPKRLVQRRSSHVKARPNRLGQGGPRSLPFAGQTLRGARPAARGRPSQSTRPKHVLPARATHCRALGETATEERPPGTEAFPANSAGAVLRFSCAFSLGGSTFRLPEPRRKSVREGAAHLVVGRRQAAAPISVGPWHGDAS